MVSEVNKQSSPMNIKWQETNILSLAYLGDAVYELWVREHLLEKGIAKVEELHKAAVDYVQARFQASLLKVIIDELDETEADVVRRGRNAKGHHPRNIDVITYRHATAFEALVGYWFLTKSEDRMQAIFNRIDDLKKQIELEKQ